MARVKKAKTPLVFSAEAFVAARSLLRATMNLPVNGPFGRAPRVRMAIAEYSDMLDLMFEFLPAKQVAAAKKLALVGGHVYDLRKMDAMAHFRLATAELLM
jgi:hypothetical protein